MSDTPAAPPPERLAARLEALLETVGPSDETIPVRPSLLRQLLAALRPPEGRGATTPVREPHPEDTCERCGRDNVTWFAPSDLWNRAVPDDRMLCPVCFIQAAERAGVNPTAWCVVPEVFDDEQVIVRPDDQQNADDDELPANHASTTASGGRFDSEGTTKLAKTDNGAGVTSAGGESGLPHHNQSALSPPPLAERGEEPTRMGVMVCGVDCHPGDANCNNYCRDSRVKFPPPLALPLVREEETITRIVAAMCFDAQADTVGRRSNRHRGRHAAKEILGYLARLSPPSAAEVTDG